MFEDMLKTIVFLDSIVENNALFSVVIYLCVCENVRAHMCIYTCRRE